MKNYKDKIINTLITIIACTFFIVFDQLTKKAAVNNLVYGQSVPFIKGLINFKLQYNTGFAFGMGNGYQFIWGIISIIGCIIIAYFMRKIDFKKNLIFSICLVLLFSGTFGNMIDRLFVEDGVIDFIDFAFMNFAVFNVADSCITIGAFFLAIYILFIYKEPDKNSDKKQEEVINSEENDND